MDSIVRLAPVAIAVLLFVASTSVRADQSGSAPATPGWSSCGLGYSQHLSETSDAGSDVKNGLLSCSRIRTSGATQTFELGAQADTPPVGRRNPVIADGVTQTVSGLPNDQRDTFETFAGFGEEFGRGPGSALIFNLRAGEINGFSTPLVRGFIDDTHRWEGKGYSRHSPLSSDGRPLIQLSGLHVSEFLGSTVSGYRLSLSDIESLTAGTSLDAMTLGLQASVGTAGSAPVLPSGIPGLPLRVQPGTGLYAGVFGQSTLYDLASEDAGSAPEFLYAKAGVSMQLDKHCALNLEFTHPLSERVRQQLVTTYNYGEVSLGIRF